MAIRFGNPPAKVSTLASAVPLGGKKNKEKNMKVNVTYNFVLIHLVVFIKTIKI